MIPAARESFAIANGRARLPYDAEVEYLQSSGTQWLDSGILPDNSTDMSIDCMSLASGGYNAIGEWNGATNSCYAIFMSGAYGYVQAVVNGQDSRISARGTTTYNTRHVLRLDKGNLLIDNVNRGRITPALAPVANYTIWIGAINNLAKQSGRIYGATILKGGVLVRDLIPVRVGTTGEMYDKVSGQLFASAGTGSFTSGPDKTA